MATLKVEKSGMPTFKEQRQVACPARITALRRFPIVFYKVKAIARVTSSIVNDFPLLSCKFASNLHFINNKGSSVKFEIY